MADEVKRYSSPAEDKHEISKECEDKGQLSPGSHHAQPETVDPASDMPTIPPDHPGGDDDDGGGDDDNGEGTGEEEDDIEDRVDTYAQNELVLDPDHPLMKRFQAALRSHLERLDGRLTLEIKELEESLKARNKEREELGVELYGIQQELAHHQMLLERLHDEYTRMNQQLQKEEEKMGKVRNHYKTTQLNHQKESMTIAQLREEVENLALRIFYMEKAKEDVRSDIAVMRRAAEKVETEVSKAEVEKQKQDLYVNRLVEEVDKLKEQVAMYEAQEIAQSAESHATKRALTEAQMEMEAIRLEKKQLYQQWTSCLIGMSRRNEAHVAIQSALDLQDQEIMKLDMELEGYKHSIQKEQQHNEKLTMDLTRIERDIESVKKQLAQCQARSDALKAEYTMYTRMLRETEQALSKATAEKVLTEKDEDSLKKQIQRQKQINSSVEDQIMDRLHAQLTLDKTAHYTKRLIDSARDHTKVLETELADIENNIACDILNSVKSLTRIEHLKGVHKKLEAEVAEKNNVISLYEGEIQKRHAVIHRKQTLIDQNNKKLDTMIHAAGGMEVCPMELQINSMARSLDRLKQEVREEQQLWLRQQNELVKLSYDRDSRSLEVDKLKQKLTLFSQQKIRADYEIEGQQREIHDIKRTSDNLRKGVIRLNWLIHCQKMKKTALHEANAFTENDFVADLKDREQESIELAAKVEAANEEKERMLNELVEKKHQCMLWEKKEILAREARAALKCFDKGEIRNMKAEIHRMKVRYAELMKMQEKLIQDMEKSVTRRETMETRGYIQSKTKKKLLTKGTFERQKTDLRRKINATIQEANKCGEEIQQLQDHQAELNETLEKKQINYQAQQETAVSLDLDIEHLLETKQMNMTKLLQNHQRAKYYLQAKEGRYTMLCRSETSLGIEKSKQEDVLQSLSQIMDCLKQQFPACQSSLHRLTVSLNARSAGKLDTV